MTVVNRITSIFQAFLQLNWVQKLLVIVIILLAGAGIFRILTPTQAEVQTAILSTTTSGPAKFQNINYEGNYPAVPPQLSTATMEYTNISDSLTKNMFTAFSIQSQESTRNVWRGAEYEVIKTDEPLMYNVSRITLPPTTLTMPGGFNQQQAITEANKIIDGMYGSNPKPTLMASKIQTLGPEGDEVVDGGSTENFIVIPYTYTLDDVPIFVDHDNTYAASIILDTSYSLQKASFRPYSITTSNKKNFPTIDPATAVGEINQNNAAIVFYQYKGPNAADFSNINSGTLNTTAIEYRADTSTNTIVPYYKFTGNIQNAAGYAITSDIITPAIKTNFDKPQSE